jgi:hypothetical protein
VRVNRAAEVHRRGGQSENGDAGGEPGGRTARDGDGTHRSRGHLNGNQEEDQGAMRVFGLDPFAVHAIDGVEQLRSALRHRDAGGGEAILH